MGQKDKIKAARIFGHKTGSETYFQNVINKDYLIF